jgi:hypothetical protein
MNQNGGVSDTRLKINNDGSYWSEYLVTIFQVLNYSRSSDSKKSPDVKGKTKKENNFEMSNRRSFSS